jgi:hypothetical protein
MGLVSGSGDYLMGIKDLMSDSDKKFLELHQESEFHMLRNLRGIGEFDDVTDVSLTRLFDYILDLLYRKEITKSKYTSDVEINFEYDYDGENPPYINQEMNIAIQLRPRIVFRKELSKEFYVPEAKRTICFLDGKDHKFYIKQEAKDLFENGFNGSISLSKDKYITIHGMDPDEITYQDSFNFFRYRIFLSGTELYFAVKKVFFDEYLKK